MFGAEDGVEAIREAGHEIYWVTTPWSPCKEWGQVRRDWLKRHFQVDPKDVVITGSKFLIDGDVFIDDRIDNVLQWREHHPEGKGLLHRVPSVLNARLRNPEWGDPTFAWDEIGKLLESLDS